MTKHLILLGHRITRIFSIFLFIGLAWGQEEWIYYNNYGLLISESATHRIRPDNSNTELYMDGLSLLDISEDEETFLYESYKGKSYDWSKSLSLSKRKFKP